MKKLVKFSFSRFAESYEREAFLQKEAAQILADFSKDLKGKGIDLGCGTGFLYDFLENKNLIGVDISKEMLSFYTKRNKNSVLADIEHLPFKKESFDFAVSNFSLHWTDLKKSFQEVYRVLKKNGKFIFNIPFEGSLESIRQITGDIYFDFLCVPDILKILKGSGFSIEDFFKAELELEFENGYQLLSHLHKTGVSIGSKKTSLAEKRKIVKQFKEYNKTVPLNFNLLFVKAYKKKGGWKWKLK